MTRLNSLVQKLIVLCGALALEVAALYWPFLYEKNFEIYLEKYNKAKDLELTKATKQENYIYREQEYRQVILDLKTKIDQIS